MFVLILSLDICKVKVLLNFCLDETVAERRRRVTSTATSSATNTNAFDHDLSDIRNAETFKGLSVAEFNVYIIYQWIMKTCSPSYNGLLKTIKSHILSSDSGISYELYLKNNS